MGCDLWEDATSKSVLASSHIKLKSTPSILICCVVVINAGFELCDVLEGMRNTLNVLNVFN